MDTGLLQQFRQQLATWIEVRLETQRLPFQRLELSPEVLTELGYLVPDLVLWINRDSQLAGSIILLPDSVDSQVLDKGAALAKAMGLGHFTTWAAQGVTVWELTGRHVDLRQEFLLPPVNRVTPEDFQQTLDALLDLLKIVTVTSAPHSAGRPAHYFANLCLRNLQELAPGLTTSARLAAGQTAADKWLEQAPREKAWLSLWRILYLLCHDRLPPGLQPERLELAIHYALSDLTEGDIAWLCIQENEPRLPDGDAVRLHHLAGRLKQIGWPLNKQQAEKLLCLLLNEAARDFGLVPVQLPWQTEHVRLWVDCQPPLSEDSCSLVAPRAFLAGWALKTSLSGKFNNKVHAVRLQDLDATLDTESAIAVLRNGNPLERMERDSRKILLRQVWPSRRFDLPRATPAWVWDAIHLSGLASGDLSLSFPQDWHLAPGIASLWVVLEERFQLVDLAVSATGEQVLHFTRKTTSTSDVLVHRQGRIITVPGILLSGQPPGITQAWLKADGAVLDLMRSKSMTMPNMLANDSSDSLTWGLYLYLHTRLGRYFWNLLGCQSVIPEVPMAAEMVLAMGMPIPNEIMLAELSLIGSPEKQIIPVQEILEQEFKNILGEIPVLPETIEQVVLDTPRSSRRNAKIPDQISAKVFVDGLPRFPEHYLMHVYRPKLVHYDLCGPLEIEEVFFDRVSLRGADDSQQLEVSGMVKAEALVLASYSSCTKVSIPEDDRLLAEMVEHYRADLLKLWDKLNRESRRCEPSRQTAIKLAARIWLQTGLPPVRLLRQN